MYEIMVEDQFSAAHQLIGYDGKCEQLHGHNWRVQVCVRALSLDQLGFVMDFSELKNLLGQVLDEFDHTFLNELDFFINTNPTAENIARYIMEKLSTSLGAERLWLHHVRVFESDRSSASVFSPAPCHES
ncbi:6-carboxytetrahydropterin synthase QueD [bacterium]|nr:6-carboxytetrahydropterin synthase QueD [bacterium]